MVSACVKERFWLYGAVKWWLRSMIFLQGIAWCCADVVYPIAPQSGPSCGFFANVPALTMATGVDISSSMNFIAPIYQLHRGDARLAKSFSKEKFYELFAIPYRSHEIKHDDLPPKQLAALLANRIETLFDAGLSKGNVYSLRVIGVFGGPHNALLMAKERDFYIVHDPFPGTVKRLKRDQLAAWILVPTSATKKLPKKRYITNYLEVTLPPRRTAPWKKLSELPSAMMVEWNEQERKVLSAAFSPSAGMAADALDRSIQRFPRLDFAALPPEGLGKPHQNALREDLDAAQLNGVLNLAMFSLSVWHMNHRDRVPVLFLRGRPHVLTAYRLGGKEPENQTTLVFDDGREKWTMTQQETLIAFKESGCHYATICLPCREPSP
jgi:hypothetical protein